MLQSVKKGLIAVGVLVAATAQNAMAAGTLTAADVDFSGAQADITLVFLGILGVVVMLFGFRAIKSFANGR